MITRTVSLPCTMFFLLALCFSAHTQELYRWIDAEGNIHYATKYEWIPEQYRGQVAERRASKEQEQNLFPVREFEEQKQIPASGSAKDTATPDQPIQQAKTMSKFVLKSPVFPDKGKIPSKYSRRGGNISPPLIWKNPPEGTKSFVLTLMEPDAPGGAFTHWVIYNIAGDQDSLPEGVPRRTFVNGAQQVRNDFNGIGYGGPDPTGEVRRYVFRLVALDLEKIEKPRTEVLEEHTLGEATVTAFYP